MESQQLQRPTSAQTTHVSITGWNKTQSPAGLKIREKLLPATTGDADDRQRFVSECDLEDILTTDAITEILEQSCVIDKLGEGPIDPGRHICGVQHDSKRIKILATLVLIEEPAYIVNFIEHGIWDNELPLKPGIHAEFFDHWRQGHVESFYETQFWVLAPVLDFTTTKGHHEFDPYTRMPFLDALEWSQGGANGLVSVVRIHDQHQKWGSRSGPHPRYAIKRFHTGQAVEFEKERKALLRFSWPKERHDNLIELLFSYKLGPEMFMIFPGAKWNLEQFWKNTPNDPASSDELIWIIRQCQGLADGLCKVHNYGESQGRHGDIKSKNILFFEDSQNAPGRLVIADFTLMRFHSPNSEATKAWIVNNTRTYRPPEVEGPHGTTAGPKFDTWTLGCVYLEFITWHLLGCHAVSEESFMLDGQKYESFSTARKSDDDGLTHPGDDKFFFRRRQYWKNDIKLKSSVKTWIDCLRRNPHASSALRDFLGLVKNHMLVIAPNDRHAMRTVKKCLSGILDECNSCTEYSRPGLRVSKKAAMIAPPWTEKSSKYGRLDSGIYSTCVSVDGRSNDSNSDLETISRAFSDDLLRPKKQSLNKHVRGANGYLNPMDFVLGRNTPSLRSWASISSKLSRASLPRDDVDVGLRPHQQRPTLGEDITVTTSSQSTKLVGGSEQNEVGFNDETDDEQALDSQHVSRSAGPSFEVVVQTPGEESSSGSQLEGRKTHDAIGQLPRWRERLISPNRRRYQALKDKVQEAFRRVSDRFTT